MQILFVVASNKGGLPHYAAQLANEVAEFADVTVMKPTKEVSDDLFSKKVSIIDEFKPTELSVPNILNLDLYPKKNLIGMASYNNLKKIHEIDPDIVHVPTGLFPHVQYYLNKNNICEEYPVMITRHEVVSNMKLIDELARPHVLVQKCLNAVLPTPEISHTIVHTQENKNNLVSSGASKSQISVIPHGAYDFFKEYDYTKQETEENTLIYFGNIVPHKGLDVLTEAGLKASKEIKNVKIIIAGDGNLRPKVERRIQANPDIFELHNEFIENEKVGELFSRAQAAVLPYKGGKNKGHSGTLTIAYSFGIPVITSDIGEFPELVDEPGAGITIESDNVEQLANAIIDMLSAQNSRERMSQNAIKMADRLSWETIAEEHLSIYERVINDN